MFHLPACSLIIKIFEYSQMRPAWYREVFRCKKKQKTRKWHRYGKKTKECAHMCLIICMFEGVRFCEGECSACCCSTNPVWVISAFILFRNTAGRSLHHEGLLLEQQTPPSLPPSAHLLPPPPSSILFPEHTIIYNIRARNRSDCFYLFWLMSCKSSTKIAQSYYPFAAQN